MSAMPLVTAVLAEPSAQLRPALGLLLHAWHCAHDCQSDAWDFAVEVADLRAAGFTTTDLRWLFRKGYVYHAVEKTKPGRERRLFGSRGGLLFSGRSCFVLTDAGADIGPALAG